VLNEHAYCIVRLDYLHDVSLLLLCLNELRYVNVSLHSAILCLAPVLLSVFGTNRCPKRPNIIVLN